MSEVEVALEARATLGEGPVWDDREHVLYWVDITAGQIHRFEPETGRDVVRGVGRPVGAVGLRTGGGLVVALENGFGLMAAFEGPLEVVATIASDPPGSLRMNDGAVDPAGRFWAGTMAYELTEDAAALYRFDPDGSIHLMLESVTISNGIAWSGDGNTMYYIDSATGGVDAFDFDIAAGTINRRRQVIRIPDSEGMPDGLTIDAEGYLWVCLWQGWAVHRYRPDGILDRVVRLPVAQVTSCAFGGEDLSTLFVTTAREGLGDEEARCQDLAGSVFRIEPGVRGVPSNRFVG